MTLYYLPHTIHRPEQLAAILQDARREKKLNQREAGRALGISQNRFSVLESDLGEMSLSRLLILVKKLGLELVIQNHDPEALKKFEW